MRNLWAAEWNSINKLDGRTNYLMIFDMGVVKHIFWTRQECRDWIKETHGYIKHRMDLRREPHGWRLPRAVKIKIVKVEDV